MPNETHGDSSADQRLADPILSSVISSRLKMICKAMGAVVERSAHSPLLVEGRDFSLGIYDEQARMLEQLEYVPILGYATQLSVRCIAAYFGASLSEGDVILHNDPYTGGNQLSDWKILKPVFRNGQHFAWVVVNAHQADVGGAVPGSYNSKATDLWQEALRITPVKLFECGTLRRDVWDLIMGNVRLPIVGEDVRAMIGACSVGERGLIEVVERYGLETFRLTMESLMDMGETMAKAVIRRIPSATYVSECEVHDDGVDANATMRIRASVTINDTSMRVDFAGTSPQTVGYVNAPLSVTISAVMIAFFMIAGEELPHNDGVLRCIDVVAPQGCMLNATFPAATGFGNHLSDQICTVMMKALAEGLPNEVTAGWDPVLGTAIYGWDSRHGAPYVEILFNASKGGGGATYGADGYDHIGIIASGGAIAAQDPEMSELVCPHFLHRYEYLTDSGGPGEWRGGLGVETIVEFQAPGVSASVYGDGNTADSAAAGILGGKSGCPNLAEFRLPDGQYHVARLKDLVGPMPAGTIHRHVAGGGGGYGDPHRRPADVVAQEVREGLVSIESARHDYGVVIDPDTGTVDVARTSAARGPA